MFEDIENFKFSVPSTGKYEWDEETNSIVFKRFSSYEKSSIVKMRALIQTVSKAKNKQQAPKEKKKGVVAFEDVKKVALSRLKASGMNLHYSRNFSRLTRSTEMDTLILSFAKYFATFFEILTFNETFKNGPLLPSRIQLDRQEQRRELVELLRAHLARDYADFLLLERQIYMESQHVMYKPLDPENEARNDQQLFEAMHWFLVFCVWIIFSRKRFKEICNEIGWFTRSDSFNSVGRRGSNYFRKRSSSSQSLENLYATHLPMATSQKQRSPASRLLIPESRDNAPYLFHKMNKADMDNYRLKQISDIEQLSSQIGPKKYGILGSFRYLYDDQLIENRDESEHAAANLTGEIPDRSSESQSAQSFSP
ncbi:unnamed protein product [Calicophoron daubneyi]|uniref:Protein phosphatase 1 regulatory subunit 36 n=1 Tax=Calicophoron daubneyi TaxID=300641 RepID=A0AAV2TUU4_CALDB